MKLHFTALALRDIFVPEGQKPIKAFDTEQTSFGVLVNSKGPQSYFVIYRDEQGKQRQKTFAGFDSLPVHAARLKAKTLLDELASEQGKSRCMRTKTACPTVDEYFYDAYLPEVRRNSRSHETHASIYRNHVRSVLGHKKLDEVTQNDIRDLQVYLREKPVGCGRYRQAQAKTLAEGTINRVLILVRHLFNVAILDSEVLVKENPTAFLKIATDRKIKGRFLSREEMQRLIAAAKQSENVHLVDILILLGCTGLRKNNVLKLQWDWIDFHLGVINIPASADKAKKGYTIPITAQARAVLMARVGMNESKWVFYNPKTGKAYQSFRSSWVTCTRRAGLEGLRVHDLRHTFASAMLETGADLVQVKNALGHTQLKTTEIYLHVTAAKQRASVTNAANAMGF